MRNLINLHFSLFLALFKKPIETPIEEVAIQPIREFNDEIRALEQVSGMTLDEITSCRKDLNVQWKVIFTHFVALNYVNTKNNKIAEILKVDRTTIYHYLYHYKISEMYLINYNKYRKAL